MLSKILKSQSPSELSNLASKMLLLGNSHLQRDWIWTRPNLPWQLCSWTSSKRDGWRTLLWQACCSLSFILSEYEKWCRIIGQPLPTGWFLVYGLIFECLSCMLPGCTKTMRFVCDVSVTLIPTKNQGPCFTIHSEQKQHHGHLAPEQFYTHPQSRRHQGDTKSFKIPKEIMKLEHPSLSIQISSLLLWLIGKRGQRVLHAYFPKKKAIRRKPWEEFGATHIHC
jgi:hypothetical protein